MWWGSQFLLHKSQCNDSALHLSCRASCDGIKPQHFALCPIYQPVTSALAVNKRDCRPLDINTVILLRVSYKRALIFCCWGPGELKKNTFNAIYARLFVTREYNHGFKQIIQNSEIKNNKNSEKIPLFAVSQTPDVKPERKQSISTC